MKHQYKSTHYTKDRSWQQSRGYAFVFCAIIALHQIYLYLRHSRLSFVEQHEQLLNHFDDKWEEHTIPQQQQRRIRLFQQENANALGIPHPLQDNKALPLILGVGPYETSLPTVFKLISRSQDIVVAQMPDTSDLNFFSWRFGRNFSLASYQDYIAIDKKPMAAYVLEQALSYCRHPMVPYRVNHYLQNSVLVVFGIRRPLDAHVSSYFYYHRPIEAALERVELPGMNDTISIENFLEWSVAALETFGAGQACEEVVASQLMGKESGSLWTTFDGFQIPSWIGNLEVEHAIYDACYRPIDSIQFDLSHGLADYMYASNLVRWIKAVPDAPMACIFHEEAAKNPELSALRLGHRLQIEGFEGNTPLELANSKNAALRLAAVSRRLLPMTLESEKNDVLLPDDSPLRPLLAVANATMRASVHSHLVKLQNIFEGQYEFAQRFCKMQEYRSDK